jgi:hypothetical protein
MLKNLLTKKSKPLPKNTLKKVNEHLDWSVRYREFDALFEEMLNSKKEHPHRQV